jgi:hypothetical protein
VRTALRLGLGLVVVLALGALALWLALAPPAPLPPGPPASKLEGVTVIEPGLGRRPGQTLVVEGGRIVSIEPSSSGGGPYAGMYVLPGLIEMHGHLPPTTGIPHADLFFLLYLLHGVTAVRDMGDIDGTAVGPALDGLRSGGETGRRPSRRCPPSPRPASTA